MIPDTRHQNHSPNGSLFPSLSTHLASDKSFLSAYVRALVAIAYFKKTVSLSDFGELMEVARHSQYPALTGVVILHALEQGVVLDVALADLAKAQAESAKEEGAATFSMAKPLLNLQGHHARPLAKRLAAALKFALSPDDLASLPQEEEEIGLINHIGVKARRWAHLARLVPLDKGADLTDTLLDFGKSIGDPEMVSQARACQKGLLSVQVLGEHFTQVANRIERDIADFRHQVTQAPPPVLETLNATTRELRVQVEQRLAIIEARMQYERQTFAEDIDDLVHDAGNAIENSITERLHTDQWKDKDVWASIANTQFGKEAERRIERAVRRREEVLRLFKEELKLFQSDMRVVQTSILAKQHHTQLTQWMPPLRLGTRVVNAMDSAANITLGAGTIAIAGTGAAAYLLGAAVILPLVAPVAPFLAGALAVAGLFKWLTDSDKRKIAEIHSKRRAIEEVVRNRLNEASSSFNRQMEEVLHDYRQTAIVLLNPIVQDTEAVQQLHQMHRRVALRIIEQSEATMKQLSREVDKL